MGGGDNDNAFAEFAFADVYSRMNRLIESKGTLLDSCASVTTDTTVSTYYPITMTVDFGENCVGKHSTGDFFGKQRVWH